jgi:hypothetical protein
MPLTNNSDSLVTRNLTVEDSLALADDTCVEFREMAAPSTPANASLALYAKTDGKLYSKNDAGSETDLTATEARRVAKVIYIEDPLATDAFPLGYVPHAATLVAVRAVTDVGTVDFNIEKRAKLTPDVAGTDIWTVDKQATTSGLEQTSFDSGSVGEDQWLHYVASAVASSPGALWISLEYTID